MKIVWNNKADEQFAKRFMSSIMNRGGDTTFKDFINNWVSQSRIDIIYNEIMNLTGDFKLIKIDDAIHHMSNASVRNEPYAKLSSRNAQTILAVVAWFCQEAGLYWETSNWDQSKLEDALDTEFGRTLYRYDLLLNNGKSINVATATTQSAAQGAAQGATPTPTQTTAQQTSSKPNNQNGGHGIKKGQGQYAQSGKHSDKVLNLIGTPGQKQRLSGEWSHRGARVYFIQTSVGAKPENLLYIEPLIWNNFTKTAYSANLTFAKKVRLGRPHYGWACTLYFNSLSAANTFLSKYVSNHPSLSTSLCVVSKPVDKNGYFHVDTELGDAYIKAERLNEDLEEENKEQEHLTECTTKTEGIGNIDIYDDWFHASIS